MLSYRHAFHAGNHADVLKHFVLTQIISYLNQKDAPYWYVDTHAGAGLYALDTGYATKLAEHADGIGRLWERDDIPEALANYVSLVRQFNLQLNSAGELQNQPRNTLRAYPGSPWIAQQLMRPDDRLRLFELHTSDSALLQDNFRTLSTAAQRRTLIQAIDGFTGLKSVLPPQPRRGLILIDPSYEDKTDYRTVPLALNDALSRFATGTYVVWYPQLVRADTRHDSMRLPRALKALPAKSWLHAGLTVTTPADDGFGMQGSGLFIINPPWTLHKTLQSVMPYLASVLGRDSGAGYLLEYDEK